MHEALYPYVGRPREISGDLLWFPSNISAPERESKQTTFLDLVFEEKPHSSIWVSDFAAVNELNLDQITEMLSSNEARVRLEGLVNEMEFDQRYILALILSSTQIGAMSSDLRERLGIQVPQSSAQILPFFKRWYLCESSELKLKSDIEKERTVLVDNTLLVKEEGHMTGLCLRNTSTASGVFLKGMWYSPVDHDTRGAIESAISNKPEERKAELTLGSGQWVLMRDASAYTDIPEFYNLIGTVEEYAFS